MEELSDSELIDWVYTDLAGQFIRDNVTNWANPEELTEAVDKLDKAAKTTYLLGILNQQVMNGGFIEYYGNAYGRFAYETLEALREIGADKTFKLLSRSLELVNIDKKTKTDFKNLIINGSYPRDPTTEDKLGDLDDEYYALDEIEDLEKLLGAYLRKLLIGLK